MIQFKVSAPGKVILYGEHAVVDGKTAVAASLNLRSTIEFTELPDEATSEQVVEISFPKVDLSLSVSLQKIRDFFFSDSFSHRSEDHDFLYNQVQQFVAMMSFSTLQQKLSLEVFFYSFVYITYEEHIDLKPFRVHLDTQLSVGSGLGSSASFAVCLAACFLHWSRSQKNILANFNTVDLEKISRYALCCEKIMHGAPSGIDNSVCTYGSIVEFRKGEPPNLIPGIPNMKILLVDTKVERSTKMQVQRLKELQQKYPMIVNPILDSIDKIAREALHLIGKLLSGGNDAVLETHVYKQLMTFINMNQGLLYALQMSHPSLDRICTEAQNYALAAKLTGAGGGGYAYILLPPDSKPETMSDISQKLIADGFSVMSTSLGCNGVTIHE